jgi:hypothetical protein
MTPPQGMPQSAFTWGELSPSLRGRIDFEAYYKGLRTCLNFIVSKYGGVDNRPGLEFIAAAYASDKPLRMIPFQFNNEQQYVLILGDKWMQIVCNGALLTSTNPISVTGVTAAVPVPVVVSQSQVILGWDWTFIPPDGTYYHQKITGFNFAIPANSTINGIAVQYLGVNGSTSGVAPVEMVKANALYGTPKSWLPAADGPNTLGSALDLWGGTWLPADINAVSFGVDASMSNPPAGGTPNMAWSCSYVKMTVYYTITGIGHPVYLIVPGHPFVDGQKVVVTGVAPGLNGTWQIVYVDANTIGLVGCVLETIPWSGSGTVQTAGVL